MTLYFRLLWLFFKTMIFERKPISLAEDTCLKMRVLPNDLDVFRHVNNGRYLTLMDLGRFHFLLRTKAMFKIIKEGYRPTILAASLNYKKELTFLNHFILKTKVVYWDEKNIYIRHRFERKSKLMAEAIIKAVIIKGKRKTNPEEFMKELGLAIAKPEKPDYLDRFIDLHNQSYT